MSKAGLGNMLAKGWIRGLKEDGHSRTELVFLLLLDDLGVPLVRLQPPPAQGYTLFGQTARRGSGLKGLRNTLRFSPDGRSSPLFNLSSPNTKSVNQGAAVFSARLMYSRKILVVCQAAGDLRPCRLTNLAIGIE